MSGIPLPQEIPDPRLRKGMHFHSANAKRQCRSHAQAE